MRGIDEAGGALLSHVDLEERIPARHALRRMRRVVNDALVSMDAEFDRLCAADDRPSIAPERPLRASLIQIHFSVPSERQLMERMRYDLLFRWFVGPGIDDAAWVARVFSKNRDRLPTTEIARKVLAAIHAHREIAPLLGDEHFSVDGTLVKAWASVKSFQPKPEQEAAGPAGGPDDPPAPPAASDNRTHRNEARDRPDDPAEPRHPQCRGRLPGPEAFERSPLSRRRPWCSSQWRGHWQLRATMATEASVTDPEACPYGKSHCVGAVLCFAGHSLMENRHGFVARTEVTQADGQAERKAALDMVHRHAPGSRRRLTPGADKAHDAGAFVQAPRQACLTPHVAQKARFRAIDGRTTRHEGQALSQRRRKKIEEPFGRVKTVGPMARTTQRGVKRPGARFSFTMAAHTLARPPRPLAP